MLRLTEFNTDEDFEMFREVLEKASQGHIVATLKQAMKHPDGGYNYLDMEQYVANQQGFIQVNGEFVYITLHNMTKPDCKKIKSMYNIMLQHGTQMFGKGEANDYVLLIDIAHNELEKGYTYIFSCLQPIFVSGDGDDDLTLVFAINNVLCGKESVSMYDVEYEKDMREAREDEVHKFVLDDDLDENEDEDNSFDEISGDGSDFVNTDEYTTGM